ncbi:MAG: hypothetical protein V1720_20685 [bacterium]
MKQIARVFTFGLLMVFTFTQCGKSEESKTDQTSEQVQEAKDLTPNEISIAIVDIYIEAMTKVTELVKGNPAAAEVNPKIQELKDKYVAKLVELGKVKEKLSPADKSMIDNKIWLGIGRLSPDVMKEFSAAVTYYIGKDEGNKTHFLISSFNIITQYADFELLKKQLPEEAKRLGIN